MMYRSCCRGFRPCMWTLAVLLLLHIGYRALLVLEGRGTLRRHGITMALPRLGIRGRKAAVVTIPTDFLIEERDYCTAGTGLLAVALIPSLIEDRALRDETRQTWGQALQLGVPLGRVFLLGRPKDREQRLAVKAESQQHHDIVQGNYDDSQQAAKALNGVLWLAMHCAMVPFTVHASDKVLLDVFLLQSFLWEVLESPDKQYMLFGKLLLYEPPEDHTESGWSLKDLGYLIPEVTELPMDLYPPYFDDGAWFGRTHAVAKLLSVSNSVPLVSPSSVYLTGLLASAAGLYKSPSLFNAWWSTDEKVRPEDIGVVLGWLNDTITPPRPELWEQLKKHHSDSIAMYGNQIVRRDIKVTLNATKKTTQKAVVASDAPHSTKKMHTTKKLSRQVNKYYHGNTSVIITRPSFNITDPKIKVAYLRRKKQLEKMIRTTERHTKFSRSNVGAKNLSQHFRTSLVPLTNV